MNLTPVENETKNDKMQIAGQTCKVCERTIVFASAGKYCAHCGTVVHLLCEPKAQCGVCGLAFQSWEPPEPDPRGQALIPRTLRFDTSGGVIAAIAFAAILVGLALLVQYALKGTAGRN